MNTRIGSVVDCSDLEFARLVAFRREVLGYRVGSRSEDWCRLDAPHGRVNLSFQVVPDPTPGKNKLHLDLYTTNQQGEVERLLALGATVHRLAEPGDDFVVLKDPAGNQLCMTDKS